MLKVKVFGALFLGMLVLFTGIHSVLAASNPITPPPSGKMQKYCVRAVKTVNNILTQSTNRLANRQKYINARKANIQQRIANLQKKGADITFLQNDSQQFFSYLDQWYFDYQKYLSLIQNTQSFTCGDSNGKFVNAVQVARAQLKVVDQDKKTFLSYYQNTLSRDFINARLSIKNTIKNTKK